MDDLKQRHLDPLIEHLSPETDFRTIEAAFMTLVSEFNKKCVGPASEEVLNAFIAVIKHGYKYADVHQCNLVSCLIIIRNKRNSVSS